MARSRPTDPSAPPGTGKAATGPGSRGRGKGATKVGKDGRPKVGRLKKVGDQARMMKQAYSLTRKNDPKLPWLMLIAFVAVAAVFELIGVLLGSPFLFLPIAVLFGALAALILFGRRAQGSAYRQVEGQPGAAAWVLEGMRGDWQVSPGVAGTTQLDALHRVPGRPGGLLVGGGAAVAVPPVLAPGQKRL